MEDLMSYGKKSTGQWIAIYAVIGLLVYGGIYFFMGQKGEYKADVATEAMMPEPSSEAMMEIADKLKTGKNAMTLYVFDKDAEGVSNCYDQCATNWPPYMVEDDKMMVEGLTVVMRQDGTKQYAMDGKPLYYYIKDLKAGDMMGDGVNGVWHLAK